MGQGDKITELCQFFLFFIAIPIVKFPVIRSLIYNKLYLVHQPEFFYLISLTMTELNRHTLQKLMLPSCLKKTDSSQQSYQIF